MEFSKPPAIVAMRKTLSKARHQYFTSLLEERNKYQKEYLELKMRKEEKPGPESSVIGHVIEGGRLAFFRTAKVG